MATTGTHFCDLTACAQQGPQKLVGSCVSKEKEKNEKKARMQVTAVTTINRQRPAWPRRCLWGGSSSLDDCRANAGQVG